MIPLPLKLEPFYTVFSFRLINFLKKYHGKKRLFDVFKTFILFRFEKVPVP
jgi:hypothetical protein